MYVGDLEASTSFGIIKTVLDRLSRGEKIISLAIGEPLYDTPKEITGVATSDMEAGDTHYTSSYGTAEVREAIVEKVARKNSINSVINNTIFISSRHAIYTALLAIGNRKNEVLVPDPGYFYTNPAKLTGLNPVTFPLTEDNSIDIKEIEERINERTAAVFINSPANPTGRIVDRKVLSRLLELAREHNFFIISDEAYEDLVYEGKHVSVGSMEEKPEHVISIFTLSKSYSMTGWRSGYTVAPEWIVENMSKVLDHSFSCYPPFVQKASAFALLHGDRFINEFRSEFREKRDFLEKRLRSIDGIKSSPIEGAFYAFPRYAANVKSADLARGLLEEKSVAVLPGIAFGDRGENHVRISFSGGMEDLREGMDRFEEYISRLK